MVIQRRRMRASLLVRVVAVALLSAMTILVLGLAVPVLALPIGVTLSGAVIVTSGVVLLRRGGAPGRPSPRHVTAGGAAALVYGSGQLLLGLQPVITGATPAYPAPGDLLSIGAVPLGLWMLVAFPRPVGEVGRLRRLLPDALVAGLAGALLLWRLVFLGAATDRSSALAAAVVIVTELTLVALVLQLAVTSMDRGTAVLAIGLANLVAADTLTSRVTLHAGAATPWASAAFQCVAWPLVCAGLAMVAVDGRGAPRGQGVDGRARAESRASSTTVVLLFGCAIGAVVASPHGRADLVTALLLVALTVTLGVRELILQRLRVHQVRTLSHLADHDPLTALGNRRAVRAELERLRAGAQASVLVLDLDGFKGVNDQLGHSAGDALLIEVAAALRCLAPGELTAFRLGGDEFVLVGAVDTTRMLALALGVSGAVAAAAARVPGVERVRLSASSGVAGVDVRDPLGVLAVLAEASTAMHVAKRTGRDRVVLHDADLAAVTRRSALVDARLRTALDRGEVVAHLQPLVDLASGRVVGFEALARWHDEDLGNVPPLEFVAAAEASGLVVALGRAVLRSALGALVMCGGVERGLSVSVNASPIELRAPGVVEGFQAALAEHGVPADLLVVEVTESVLVEVGDPAVVALGELRAMGVGISVDDFGTGYSSLACLTRMPVDVLKIDRSMVEAVGEPGVRAVVEAVTTLGRALGLTLVAEGIEQTWQAETMAALGVHHGQGWLWSKALPPAQAAALVAPAITAPVL